MKISATSVNLDLVEHGAVFVQNSWKQSLEWLLNSPSLFSASVFPRVEQEDLILCKAAESKIDPSRFERCVFSRPRIYKLGIFAEALLGALFEQTKTDHDQNFLLGSHHSVYQEKLQLGELDFVVQRQSVEHWELAVKFFRIDHKEYLRPTWRMNHWLGPEGKGTLEEKWERLQKQLLLGKNPLVQAHFGIKTSKVLSRGMLFYPWGISPTEKEIEQKAPYLDPCHLKGWWIPLDQSHRINMDLTAGNNKLFLFKTVQRPDWIAPVSSEGLLPLEQMDRFFENNRSRFYHEIGERLPMTVLFERDPQSGIAREHSKGFVVYQ